MPLTLGLLVDTSMSQRRILEKERKAGYQFFEQVLRPQDDLAFVISFDVEVELLEELTNSRQQLHKALSRLEVPTSFAYWSGEVMGWTAQERFAVWIKTAQGFDGSKNKPGTGYCRFCGKRLVWGNYGECNTFPRPRGAWEVEHNIPKSRTKKGVDPDRPSNLLPACCKCNDDKGTMTGREFIAHRKKNP